MIKGARAFGGEGSRSLQNWRKQAAEEAAMCIAPQTDAEFVCLDEQAKQLIEEV